VTKPIDENIEVPARFRLDGVDVLRGLCVLLVTLHHIHLRFKLNHFDVDHTLPPVINQVLFWSGYYAVIVFFVISGFLITGLSIRRWETPANIQVGHFYLMRFARIAPTLILLLVVLCVLHLADAHDFVINPDRTSLARVLTAALTFHINWFEGHHGYLPGSWDILWSLSVEEMFYLVFPLLCVFIRGERWLVWPLLCLIVVGPINRAMLGDQEPWRDYAYLSCMDGIAFGCLAALVCARQRLSRRTLRLGFAIGAIAAVLVIVLCNEHDHTGLSSYGLNVTVLEFGIASMLVALGSGVANGAMAKGTGWIRVIGRSSYEIYLFHMLVVTVLVGLFKQLQPDLRFVPLWYLAMLLLSVLLGYAVSKIYSEPLNRKIRQLYPLKADPLPVLGSVARDERKPVA
jgi:peptidoglycan/LPS O-acetylase OafA/YrhL